MRFDLLAEMERDGFSSSRKSSSRNGQINGNCIFGCGGLGEDRLRVQPNYGENGWFICEHCNTKGTSIDYLMIKRGYTKEQDRQSGPAWYVPLRYANGTSARQWLQIDNQKALH